MVRCGFNLKFQSRGRNLDQHAGLKWVGRCGLNDGPSGDARRSSRLQENLKPRLGETSTSLFSLPPSRTPARPYPGRGLFPRLLKPDEEGLRVRLSLGLTRLPTLPHWQRGCVHAGARRKGESRTLPRSQQRRVIGNSDFPDPGQIGIWGESRTFKFPRNSGRPRRGPGRDRRAPQWGFRAETARRREHGGT
jgi:hypothetical protein